VDEARGSDRDHHQEYPVPMPIPLWASDAVGKLTDHDSLVLCEATLDESPVIAVAHLSTDRGPADRVEFQLVGVLLDTDLHDRLVFNEELRFYPLSEFSNTRGGDTTPITE
jgi:hypothetical protein